MFGNFQNSAAGAYSGVSAPNKNMPPPGQQPPRRHPDFAKDQGYPPYAQPRAPMYGKCLVGAEKSN